VAKVSLTGSVPTGQKVYAAAAAGIRAVTMELGGKSPLVIFDDADLDSAVGAAMLANFYSAGQVCSNGTRVFVQNAGPQGGLSGAPAARTEAIVMGDPLDDATQMGPLVSRRAGRQGAGLHRHRPGRRRAAGHRWRRRRGRAFVQPTVFADVTDTMTIAREEIFGPVMAVLAFDTEAEVIARANATLRPCRRGVHRDLTRAHRVIGRLQAGTCWINAYNLTPVEAPFGGSKLSGVGRENGHAAMRTLQPGQVGLCRHGPGRGALLTCPLVIRPPQISRGSPGAAPREWAFAPAGRGNDGSRLRHRRRGSRRLRHGLPAGRGRALGHVIEHGGTDAGPFIQMPARSAIR
jgi:betaine-aldehyde dehydrogenase